MTAKEYLRQAYRLDKLVASYQRELSRLRELSGSLPGTDMSQERVQGGAAGGSRVEDVVIRIIEQEHRINDTIDKLVDLKEEIAARIDAVPNDTHRLILRYRYINFMTWESIAVEMSYGIRHVYKLHGQALREFERLAM